MAETVKIDIISDVVCPWCIIGYQQLQRALARFGDEVKAEITWHPFELNPQMPETGQDLGDYMRSKYGTSPEQARANRARLKSMGDDLDFPFHFPENKMIFNSFKAHQLLHWAEETMGEESQTRLKLAFFKAYFQDNLDISDEDVLLDIVAQCGFDPDEGRGEINDPENEAATRAHIKFWQERGVTGVPAIIFEQDFMVPGAQSDDVFASVIAKIMKKKNQG